MNKKSVRDTVDKRTEILESAVSPGPEVIIPMIPQNNIRSPEVKNICDGLGCFNAVTTKIDEAIGNMGRIVLDLCDDCLLKFREQ